MGTLCTDTVHNDNIRKVWEDVEAQPALNSQLPVPDLGDLVAKHIARYQSK